MSFETITIYRDFPIKNGYVQIPPNKPLDNNRIDIDTAISLATNAEIVRLSLGSGQPSGSKFGQQQFLRLDGINPSSWYTTDPVEELNS